MTFNVTAEDENHDDSTSVKEDAEDDDNDAPVVFLCGKCNLTVGDSLSWDRGEEEENQIILNRVTANVLIGKETSLHEHGKKKSVCGIVHLSCRGCQSLLGMVYMSTPKNLDYKRYKFSLNVSDIESYVLGSADKQMAMGPKEQPVTLVNRYTVEQQLEEMKSLVVSLANRLTMVEANLE